MKIIFIKNGKTILSTESLATKSANELIGYDESHIITIEFDRDKDQIKLSLNSLDKNSERSERG